jgi:pimeloyl-ACP methyl ester carboxylesterase
MTEFVPWSSQPLEEWTQKYAPGKIIKLDGRSTHDIDMGSGEPVILVHGFFYDTFTWHNNLQAPTKQFRVLAIDLWGFGYSTRQLLDYGYPLYTSQLRQFMDDLEIPKATPIGHFIGGGTSIF